MENECEYCTANEMKNLTVTAKCDEGFKTFNLQFIESCACKPCRGKFRKENMQMTTQGQRNREQ